MIEKRNTDIMFYDKKEWLACDFTWADEAVNMHRSSFPGKVWKLNQVEKCNK